MKIQFTCDECHSTWLAEEVELNHNQELICPVCSFRWDVNLDVNLDESSEYFYCEYCNSYHPVNEIVGDDDPCCSACYQLKASGISNVRIAAMARKS